MSHDSDYLKRRAQEKIKKNIIKWWNVSVEESRNYVGSLELEDPTYGCFVYTPSKQYLHDKELEEQLLLEQEMQACEEQTNEASSEMISTEAEITDDVNPEEEAEALRLANEIFERLTREANADEAAKQAEIEAAKMAASGDLETSTTESAETGNEEANPSPADANFNAATGSYSGLYGQTPMSSEEADSFASIMSTNSSFSKSIDDLIRENQQ